MMAILCAEEMTTSSCHRHRPIKIRKIKEKERNKASAWRRSVPNWQDTANSINALYSPLVFCYVMARNNTNGESHERLFICIYYSSAFRRAAAAVALTESDDFLRSTSLPPNAPSGPRVRVIISIARRLAQMYESKNVAHTLPEFMHSHSTSPWGVHTFSTSSSSSSPPLTPLRKRRRRRRKDMRS